MLFLILAIIAVGVIIFIAITNSAQNSNNYNSNNYSPPTYFEQPSVSDRRPKISAEVSEDFYNSVHEYCQNNSMTISALIRKAVGSYIDFDSSITSTNSISSAENSGDFWKCPLCETLNANYVGTCACGGTKDSPPRPVLPKPSYIRKDGSWKCPKCGTINAAYVGSCSCGQNKDS